MNPRTFRLMDASSTVSISQESGSTRTYSCIKHKKNVLNTKIRVMAGFSHFLKPPSHCTRRSLIAIYIISHLGGSSGHSMSEFRFRMPRTQCSQRPMYRISSSSSTVFESSHRNRSRVLSVRRQRNTLYCRRVPKPSRIRATFRKRLSFLMSYATRYHRLILFNFHQRKRDRAKSPVLPVHSFSRSRTSSSTVLR